MKSNFLSSQMVSHSFSPSSLPFHKAKWVQLNGKTLQVLKKSLEKSLLNKRCARTYWLNLNAVLCIQAMQLTHPYGLVVTIWPTQEIGLGQQASITNVKLWSLMPFLASWYRVNPFFEIDLCFFSSKRIGMSIWKFWLRKKLGLVIFTQGKNWLSLKFLT